MKKLRYLFLCSMLVLVMCACGKKKEEATDTNQVENILYQKGLDVTLLMNQMIQSDRYIDMMVGRANLEEEVASLRAGSYKSPKAVYEISMSDDYYTYLLGIEGIDINDMSDQLKESIITKAKSQMASNLNAKYVGVTAVATANIFQGTAIFDCEGFDNNVSYLYVYDNGYPIIVTFTKGQDNAVMASGSFLFSDSLEGENEEEIKASMQKLYMMGDLTVKEVQYIGEE